MQKHFLTVLKNIFYVLKNIFSQFFSEWSSGVWLLFGQPGRRAGGTEGGAYELKLNNLIYNSFGKQQLCVHGDGISPSHFNRIHCELHLGCKLEAGCSDRAQLSLFRGRFSAEELSDAVGPR